MSHLGGGGAISDSILGGTKPFFLLNLYNLKNIGGGARASPAPLLCSPWIRIRTSTHTDNELKLGNPGGMEGLMPWKSRWQGGQRSLEIQVGGG